MLIVIAIIVILSVMLIIVINPVETLRKSRDSQRISDLNTLKTAIGIYTTSVASTSLGTCTVLGATFDGKIYYSLPTESCSITKGTAFTGSPTIGQVTRAPLAATDSTDWIPINLSAMAQGSPISAFPVDPVNSMVAVASPKNSNLVYRYGCYTPTMTWEVNGRLKSSEYTTVTNRMASDGGNNDNLYEVGTNLKIFPIGEF